MRSEVPTGKEKSSQVEIQSTVEIQVPGFPWQT